MACSDMPKATRSSGPRPAVPIQLNTSERQELDGFARSRSLPHDLVVRAKVILLAADGLDNLRISDQVGLSRIAVGKWRRRYAKQGLPGIYDQLRSGRPRTIADENIARLVSKTLKRKPQNATHWSVRSMAEEVGLSKSTVQRVWRTFGLQPHRQKHFKLSTDPFFVEKLRDIVGLYLNPPRFRAPSGEPPSLRRARSRQRATCRLRRPGRRCRTRCRDPRMCAHRGGPASRSRRAAGPGP